MSKVNNEKSDTKKKDGDNGLSFRKNTSDFHEDKELLTEAATAPVQGAFGNGSPRDMEKSGSTDRTSTATGKDSKSTTKSKSDSITKQQSDSSR